MPLDPFEGRLQFLDQLRHLSASQSASLKLSMFALKHRTLHEDLYSCILEELPSTTLNDKVNIFFFLGTLMEQSEKAQFPPYGDMIRRDLDRIVGDVVPVDGGAANVAPAKKVRITLNGFVGQADCRCWKAYWRRDWSLRVCSILLWGYLMSGRQCRLFLREANCRSADTDIKPAKTFFSQAEIRRRMEEDRERVIHHIFNADSA